MTKFSITIHLLILMLAGPCLAAEATPPQMRTWKSTAGTTLEAEYVKMKGDSLELRRADGSSLVVPLASLSEEDRKAARELAVAAGHLQDAGSGQSNRAGPRFLPVFADGKWKDMHAVYLAEGFRAWIDAEGTLNIQPMDKGKETGPVLTNSFGAFYSDLEKPNKQNLTLRKVAEFKAPPPPVVHERGKVEIVTEAVLKDGPEVRRVLSFEAGRITAHVDFRDPPGLKYPSVFHMDQRVPRSIEDGTFQSMDELKNMTKGWKLTLQRANTKNKLSYLFWEEMNTLHRIVEAGVAGPWGDTSIGYDLPPRGKDNEIRHASLLVYPATAPKDGFVLRQDAFASPAEIDCVISISGQ